MTLHYWDAYWGLSEEQCPCDIHFTQWLAETGQKGKTIYHFGSGGHHHVGVQAARDGLGNVVLSVTAAPQEYDDYVKLLIENPEIAKHYICYFGDIYTVNARLMPPLDIVTLFHTGEFRTEKNDAYGALSDLEVGRELAKVTRAGGFVLFYTGSFAADVAARVAAAMVEQGILEPAGTFKTLMLYRRTEKTK